MGEAAGFWSYVRKDDEGDYGRIRALACDVRTRYGIQTGGDPLELFVDRESIQWGDAWKMRIDTAIAGTTFFIPVITPSYFRSEACRHELLKFAREAERLGLAQLLMPIYWVRVPELEQDPEGSADEAIRIVAKYNREDLRSVGLEDQDSSVYRKAVDALAHELVKRADAASGIADLPVAGIAVGEPQPEDDDPGIIERLVAMEDGVPRAVEALNDVGAQMQAVNVVLDSSGQKIQAASARGQGMKAVLTITNRLAQELEEPAGQMDLRGRDFGRVVGEIDPGMQAQLDLIENHDGPLTAENKATLRGLLELVDNARTTAGALNGMLAEAQNAATFSRSLRAPLGRIRGGLLGVLDGNAVIEEWGRRASTILEEGDDHDLPSSDS